MKKKIVIIILIIVIIVFSIIGIVSYDKNYKTTSNSKLLRYGECCSCDNSDIMLDVCCSCREKNIFFKIIKGWKMITTNYYE